jgi:hypothetical protein
VWWEIGRLRKKRVGDTENPQPAEEREWELEGGPRKWFMINREAG